MGGSSLAQSQRIFFYWGFLATFVVVLVLLIRRQVRVGRLVTSDEDFKVAKRGKTIAMILWLAAIPLGFVIRPLLDVVIARVI